MNSTLIVWIVSVCMAFVFATMFGVHHPFISEDTKERLKSLETERGYKCDIVYKNRPIVEISERYNLRIGLVLVGAFLCIACIIPVFSTYGNEAASYFLGDNLLLCRLVLFIISFSAHAAFWMILSFYSFSLSDSRFLALQKEYERRSAVVELKRRTTDFF